MKSLFGSWPPLVDIMLGLVFIALAFSGLYSTQQFVRSAEPAQAEVLSKLARYVELEYSTAGGQVVQAEQEISRRSFDRIVVSGVRQGDTLGILYDPQNPGRFEFQGFWGLYANSVFFFVLGALSALYGGWRQTQRKAVPVRQPVRPLG